MRQVFLASFGYCCLAINCSAVEVEGDAGLLQILRATQLTNDSLFPAGRARATTRDRATNAEADVTIVWNDRKVHLKYALRQQVGATQPGAASTRSTVEASLIETPGKLYWYSARTQLAQISAIPYPGAGYPKILDIQPDRCWYRESGPENNQYESLRWSEILNPANHSKGVTKLVVRRLDDDHVVVECHFHTGSHQAITASLRHGGNIVRYDTVLCDEDLDKVPAVGMFCHWGSYQWAKTKAGAWYPKHCEFRQAPRGDPKDLNFDFTMDIHEFDPDYKPKPEEFTVASLKLAPGTTVEETGKRNRTYRIGPKGTEDRGVPIETLNRLGDSLQQSGFAAPKPDMP